MNSAAGPGNLSNEESSHLTAISSADTASGRSTARPVPMLAIIATKAKQ